MEVTRMQCSMDDPAYKKMYTTIKQAIDEYTTVHPDLHVAVQFTIKMPAEDDGTFHISMHEMKSGDESLTQPEPLEMDEIPSQNDGHDPTRRLMEMIMRLARAGHRDDALALAKRGVELFPLSPTSHLCLGLALMFNDQEEEGRRMMAASADILDTDEWALSRPEYTIEERLQVSQFCSHNDRNTAL